MLRRTLLCAVFTCPAAWLRLPAAQGLQALLTLLWAMPRRTALPLWRPAGGGFGAGTGRAVFALCLSLALSAALGRAASWLAPPPPLDGWARALCQLSGCMAQAYLILRVQRTGRRHYALCPMALALFIACTR